MTHRAGPLFTGTLVQVHYHAREGGVSRVMAWYGTAFRAYGGGKTRTMVVADTVDGIPEVTAEDTCVSVPGCGYRGFESAGRFLRARDQLRRRLIAVIGTPGLPRPVHVVGHNLNLGKNCALSAAFAAAARRFAGQPDFRFFNVVHDLAEQGRAGLLRRIARLSGRGIDIRRDLYCESVVMLTPGPGPARLLAALGQHSETVSNPVVPAAASSGARSSRAAVLRAMRRVSLREGTGFEREGPLLLCPGRVIARKNILEDILVACLVHQGNLVTGGAGSGPAAARYFRRVRSFARRMRLPVFLDMEQFAGRAAGGRAGVMARLYQSADFCITTSVAEGFGYQFYEPWLYGKTVIGRDCRGDVRKNGLREDHLYRALLVPADWIDCAGISGKYDRLRRLVAAAVKPLMGHGRSGRIRRRLPVGGGRTDFGTLDSINQIRVLRRLLNDPGAIGELRFVLSDNSTLTADQYQKLNRSARTWAGGNRKMVRRHFSFAAFSRRLSDVFSTCRPDDGKTGSVAPGHRPKAGTGNMCELNLLMSET